MPTQSAWETPVGDRVMMARAMTSAARPTTATAPDRYAPTCATRRPLVLHRHARRCRSRGRHAAGCLAVGVVGWFLADAGAHGAPRDGLRMGALGLADGARLRASRVERRPVPSCRSGITVLCAWAIWRIGHRVGDSRLRPRPRRRPDRRRGARLDRAGRGGAVHRRLRRRRGRDRHPGGDAGDRARARPRVVLWSLALSLVVGAPAIAVGSGRAAIWATFAARRRPRRRRPPRARSLLGLASCVSPSSFLVALAVDLGTAANVMSQLAPERRRRHGLCARHRRLSCPTRRCSPAPTCSAPASPSAPAPSSRPAPSCSARCRCSRCWRRCPTTGDARAGLPSCWSGCRRSWPRSRRAGAQRRHPALAGTEGALRGCGGGIAGRGGLRRPRARGRWRGRARAGCATSARSCLDVLVHAITAFGIGGLLGGLAMTWWQRRTPPARTLD